MISYYPDIKQSYTTARKSTWSLGGTLFTTGDLFDIFNASGSGKVLRVHRIGIASNILTALTGTNSTIQLFLTTTIGTGGTGKASTAFAAHDSTQTALNANITARVNPTGGATAGNQIAGGSVCSEENSGSSMDLFNAGAGGGEQRPITLREGQGLKITNPSGPASISIQFLIVFTEEAS